MHLHSLQTVLKSFLSQPPTPRVGLSLQSKEPGGLKVQDLVMGQSNAYVGWIIMSVLAPGLKFVPPPLLEIDTLFTSERLSEHVYSLQPIP